MKSSFDKVAERSQALMQSLDESLKTQKQIASAEELKEEKPKRGFFARLFKKYDDGD